MDERLCSFDVGVDPCPICGARHVRHCGQPIVQLSDSGRWVHAALAYDRAHEAEAQP